MLTNLHDETKSNGKMEKTCTEHAEEHELNSKVQPVVLRPHEGKNKEQNGRDDQISSHDVCFSMFVDVDNVLRLKVDV